MKFLQSLKLVEAKYPVAKPPIVYKREKLVNALTEQVQVAKAMAAGTIYSKPITRKVKERESGEVKQVQAPYYPKAWWWTGEDGKVYLTLRYGKRILELTQGKYAVQLAAGTDMEATLQKFITAVDAGELDAVLERLAFAR